MCENKKKHYLNSIYKEENYWLQKQYNNLNKYLKTIKKTKKLDV